MDENIIKKLSLFFSKYPLLKFKKGKILFQPGDDFGGIYFVKKGFFRVFLVSVDGKETSLPMFKPLFYFSIISAVTGVKNQHFLEAMTPVEAWRAPREDFMKLIKEDKEIRDEVMGSFLKKFIDFTYQMGQVISGDAHGRVTSLIYSMADQFGTENGEKRAIKFKISHKQIASMTGLARETVTLQMLRLEKEGVIDNEKREIVVENMSKLRKILGYE